MQLTPDQTRTIVNGEPITIVIEQTECVVVRKDVFQQARDTAALNHDELRQAFARSLETSDWNDPAMGVYDQYDAHKQ